MTLVGVASVATLVAGSTGLALALAGAAPPPRIAAVRLWWDNIAICGNELAWPVGGIGVVVVAVLAPLGAWRTTHGIAGLAAMAVAIAVMAWSLVRARADGIRLESALRTSLGDDYRQRIPEGRRETLRRGVTFRDWSRPLHMPIDGIVTRVGVPYGPDPNFHLMDLLHDAADRPPRPVLLHLHGGGFVLGRRNVEALTLLHRMARAGWLVATIDYRLAPAARWPAQRDDAERAVAWLREHASAYGGDDTFVAATGGSAGATLAALLALSTEARVDAAVCFYGTYDVAEDEAPEAIERLVMPAARDDDPVLWRTASPTRLVDADAPPILLLHGTNDLLAPVASSRAFARALRDVSKRPVVFAEQVGASHGYDAVGSLRTQLIADATQRFLEFVRAAARPSAVA